MSYHVFFHDKEKIDLNGKTILVTGSPGFIGASLVIRLMSEMDSGTIISMDDLNDYYDQRLKEYRLGLIELAAKTRNVCNDGEICKKECIESRVEHIFIKGSIADKSCVNDVFNKHHPQIVVNLAAQAGVRYSIENPDAYIESNLIGFYNILEACRHSYDGVLKSHDATKYNSIIPTGEIGVLGNVGQIGSNQNGGGKFVYSGVEHLIYASSSSVYGGSSKIPFSTDDVVDYPVSLYAATKKSDELLAHCYSKLYDIPSTGLRFFTVYGPAGRPDMFYYSATDRLCRGETIKIFNYGDMKRDFTYIDDIVEGIIRVMQGAPKRRIGDDGLPVPPYAVYNIGGGTPENLLDFISILQEELVRAGVLPEDYDFEGHRKLVGMQPGDVPVTYADASALEEDYGFKPSIDIRTGLRRFAEWYKDYYK